MLRQDQRSGRIVINASEPQFLFGSQLAEARRQDGLLRPWLRSPLTALSPAGQPGHRVVEHREQAIGVGRPSGRP